MIGERRRASCLVCVGTIGALALGCRHQPPEATALASSAVGVLDGDGCLWTEVPTPFGWPGFRVVQTGCGGDAQRLGVQRGQTAPPTIIESQLAWSQAEGFVGIRFQWA